MVAEKSHAPMIPPVLQNIWSGCINGLAKSIMLNIPYTYKFSRDVNFVDDPNLGFPRFYFCGSLVITPYASSVLQLFFIKF